VAIPLGGICQYRADGTEWHGQVDATTTDRKMDGGGARTVVIYVSE
jgi:hypothetical protein